MRRYRVVMTHGDGRRVVLAETRRLNGALAELDPFVYSMRRKLRKRALPGEWVVSGPDEPVGCEVVAEVVVAGLPGGLFSVRYAVEEVSRAT